MIKIKKIKIFSNETSSSKQIEKKLKNMLIENKFEITKENYDLAIAIGGDGAFLRMVRECNFNSDIYYIGINTGTLGFLQEIRPNELDKFILSLKMNNYKYDEIGVLESEIITKEGVSKIYSLNELVIRMKDLKVFSSNIEIDSHHLERFSGDGLLISTSVGSSAYNSSLGGSLVYNTLHTIQLTPIAPLNTKTYRNIMNSIILPETKHIKIKPIKKSLLLCSDGFNEYYDDVDKIECYVKNKKLKFLRMKEYNYINIINEKFLTD